MQRSAKSERDEWSVEWSVRMGINGFRLSAEGIASAIQAMFQQVPSFSVEVAYKLTMDNLANVKPQGRAAIRDPDMH